MHFGELPPNLFYDADDERKQIVLSVAVRVNSKNEFYTMFR